MVSIRTDRAPHFYIEGDKNRSFLLMKGAGFPDIGYIQNKTSVVLGQTYEYNVLFSISEDINPQRNLLFQCIGPHNHDGIMDFYKLDNGLIEGRNKIFFPGSGEGEVQIRLYYKLSSQGEAKVYQVSLTPTDPVPPRWVRVACTSGIFNPTQAVAIIERAAADRTDLLLLPEYLNKSIGAESLTGETCTLLASQAKKHRMFIAAGIIRQDETTDNKYNTCVLYDRKGEFAGLYNKIHLYSPELNDEGFIPGDQVKVFDTEVGKIGVIICYDSWFTDVTELVALKGAEIVLFPNDGYYRSLIPARATDNRVRFVISSLNDPHGIFDTLGRDIQNPNQDPTMKAEGKTFDHVKEFVVDGIKLLIADLDLNCSVSPHYNGGTMKESPGGKRNRDEQLYYPQLDIIQEKKRWWK